MAKRSSSNNAPSAAEVVAQAAPALSPVEACFVGRALAAEKVREAIDGLVLEGTEAEIDVTVRFRGQLSRGEAGDRKPTSRALRRGTLALLVRRMGLQRDAALQLLAEVLAEAHALGEDAEKKLLVEHPEVEEAFTKIDEMIDKLPRIETSGRITLKDVRVERVVG
jgi:hypothetical protein